MAIKVTLFTRFLKGWGYAAGGIVPPDAVKAVEIETETGLGWKATPVPIPPATPSLAAIAASPSVATVDETYAGTTSGRTVGSTLALTGAGSSGLSIDGVTGAITGTPTAEGTVNIVETLAGAAGSPRTSAVVITVSA